MDALLSTDRIHTSHGGGDAALPSARREATAGNIAGDLTRWVPPAQPSAIVNAANERCLGGGGVDGAIHKAAGPELRKLCEALPEVAPGVRCPTGDAVFTKACGALQSMHVIYTVGPNVSGRRYENDISDRTTDPALLPAAYERTFEVASDLVRRRGAAGVSCGARYPRRRGAHRDAGGRRVEYRPRRVRPLLRRPL